MLKRNAIAVSLLIFSLGLISYIGYSLKKAASVNNSQKSLYQREEHLSWKSGAGRQLATPSAAEQLEAKRLLEAWNKLSLSEKNKNSANLIIGKVLIGLKKNTVLQSLGKPSDAYTVEPNQWGFDYTITEDWRYLVLRFDKDTVSDAFLLVNY